MAAATIIGGNGYRWRGRLIRSVMKGNATCVTMPRKESSIMAPCSAVSGAQYKVTVTASKNSGNGALLVNFFGGLQYDGTPAAVNIISSEMREYVVVVAAPDYPRSLPMYLRVWKPNKSTGNVYVRSIRFEAASGNINIPREPRLPKNNVPEMVISPAKRDPVKRIREKKSLSPPQSRRVILPVKPKENKDMKFKPYDKSKATDIAKIVLVQSPEDVPRVSIITPTRDGVELLKKCYAALNENTSYPNWEWIIGDSNSQDGTAECVKAWADTRIKLVERGTTDGSFSSINNELVGYANGEYLLFLNDDTQPQAFWLYEMVSKIHNHPEIGVVGAKLLYGVNRIQHAGIAFIPQGPANIGKSVLGSFASGYADHDRLYQAVTGACMLMRAKDFHTVKGFDPVYYFCYEDVDLCLKVKYDLGKEILYAANATLYHAESVTQKKYKTAGVEQKKGIEIFKAKWMSRVKIDFPQYQKNAATGLRKIDLSFVTCVNNMTQYRNYVIGSLFKSNTKKIYETIPVMNFGNPHSAAAALNIGIDRARGAIVVLCHQDVLFYEGWVDMLYERITEIEKRTKKWGVLGTAGITSKDQTVGVVHNIKGRIQWESSQRACVYPVQTVDEHCMVIRKSSGLRFDSVIFNGFHFYGPDICLSALSKGFINFGILCPLVHDSKSGSLLSGRIEFMRLLNALAKKWRTQFPHIRTPTSIVRKRSVRTFVRFKGR